MIYIKALRPEVIFHEPINPRGAKFELYSEAAKEAGRDELVEGLVTIRADRGAWVRYALEQINTVQRFANEIGGLRIHSWTDRDPVQVTSEQLRAGLEAMRNAVSSESFPGREYSKSESQLELAENIDAIKRMI